MAGGPGKFDYEKALCASIAFTERMDEVELCHAIRGLIGECLARQPAEVVFAARGDVANAVRAFGIAGPSVKALPPGLRMMGSLATVPSDSRTRWSRVRPAHS